jgi:hypothetical protein
MAGSLVDSRVIGLIAGSLVASLLVASLLMAGLLAASFCFLALFAPYILL